MRLLCLTALALVATSLLPHGAPAATAPKPTASDPAPSPVGEWLADDPGDRRMRLLG